MIYVRRIMGDGQRPHKNFNRLLPKLKFERNIEFSSRHKVEDRTLEWQLSY